MCLCVGELGGQNLDDLSAAPEAEKAFCDVLAMFFVSSHESV